MSNALRRSGFARLPQRWRLLVPSWIAIGLVTLLIGGIRAAGYTIPMAVQLLGYLVGLVAINLPHGGFENLQNLRTRSARFQAGYAVGFLALIAAFVGLLLVNAVLGVFLMIVVLVLKGGFGGMAVLEAVTGADHLKYRFQTWLGAGVRGGATMLVPYLAFPETFRQYTTFMVDIFDPGALAAATYAFHPLSYQILPVAFGGLVVAHLGLGYLFDPGTGTWIADAIESLLLVVFFAVVPVVLAVGLYFPLWYSARQVARSAAADDKRPVEEGAWMAGESQDSHVVSVLNWSMFIVGGVFTGLLLAGLWLLAPESAIAITEGAYESTTTVYLAAGVVFYTVFVSIIALPHVIIGGFLDRQGIWFIP